MADEAPSADEASDPSKPKHLKLGKQTGETCLGRLWSGLNSQFAGWCGATLLAFFLTYCNSTLEATTAERREAQRITREIRYRLSVYSDPEYERARSDILRGRNPEAQLFKDFQGANTFALLDVLSDSLSGDVATKLDAFLLDHSGNTPLSSEQQKQLDELMRRASKQL